MRNIYNFCKSRKNSKNEKKTAADMNKVRKAQLLVLSRTSSNTILFEDNNSFPRDFYSTFFLPPFLFSFSIRKNIKVNVLC